jgi:hypothetical protein
VQPSSLEMLGYYRPPRLPRSPLTLAWADDQRTIPDGYSRSDRGAPDPVRRVLTQA